MILHPDIDHLVVARAGSRRARDHRERRRLLSAQITTRELCRVEGTEQPDGQRTVGGEEGRRHRLRYAGVPHHVGLGAEAIADDMTRRLDARRPGVRRRATRRIHHGHLPGVRVRVGTQHRRERVRGRATAAELAERVGAMGDLCDRLRGHRADPRLEPRNDCPHREEA